MSIFCYQHHINDWRSSTASLTLVQRGVYREMLDWYYVTEGKLPADIKKISRLIGAETRKEKDAIKHIMVNYFCTNSAGFLQNKRSDIELERIKLKQKKASVSAKIKHLASANAQRTHSERSANQEPITNNREEVSKKEPPIVPPENLEIKNARARKRKSQTFINPDYQPDFKSIALAAELGIDLEAERRKFINYWQGRGDSKADWDATFRNWLDRAAEYGAQRKQRETAGRPETRDVTGSALRAVEILRQRER